MLFIYSIMRINTKKIDLELKRIGWSKYQLAKEMGRKPQWVYYLMYHAENTSLRTISRIADALGLDPKDLIL